MSFKGIKVLEKQQTKFFFFFFVGLPIGILFVTVVPILFAVAIFKKLFQETQR